MNGQEESQNRLPEDDRLIFQVFQAQQALRTHMNRSFQKAGVDVTPAQITILFLLENKNGGTMSELSRILNLDNSTLTGLIDRLEKVNFVRRSASKTDRRVFNIQITPSGLEQCQKAKPVIRSINEAIKENTSSDQINGFKTVVRNVMQRFG